MELARRVGYRNEKAGGDPGLLYNDEIRRLVIARSTIFAYLASARLGGVAGHDLIRVS